MASASERNQRALNKLVRDRRIADARRRATEGRAVLRDRNASKDQKYRARQKIARSGELIADATIVAQAMHWGGYRRQFTGTQRNAHTARLWMSGFGTMGATGERNRRGGFIADDQQRIDRAELESYMHNMSLKTMNDLKGRVYDTNMDFWNLWREQYSDTYL